MPTIAQTSVRLQLPDDLYYLYKKQAESRGADVEEVLVRRLVEAKDQDYERGRTLKIRPEDRQAIETAFSRSFKDGRELAAHLQSVFSLEVGDVTIPISPDLLKRLDGRRGRMEFKVFLIETIIHQLEHFVGLR